MSLGNRIKELYENVTRYYLPKKTYTIIRIDGKAFHTYTQGLAKPFDEKLMSDMNETAIFLCQNVQGVKLAYVQSDEISLVLSDLGTEESQAWFGGNIQKMASISASIATAQFNKLRPEKIAFFDSRVFTISDPQEVINYLIYRQEDAIKNSIQMFGHAYYSHRELNNKNTKEILEMCEAKGKFWALAPLGFQQGRLIIKEQYSVPDRMNESETVLRSRWIATDAFKFMDNKNKLVF